MDRNEVATRVREVGPEVLAALAQRVKHMAPDNVRNGETVPRAFARMLGESLTMCGVRGLHGGDNAE